MMGMYHLSRLVTLLLLFSAPVIVWGQTGPDQIVASGPGGQAYVAGEVIIKLREPALARMGKTEGVSPKQLAAQLPATLRTLNQQLGVQAIEPVFPNALSERQKLEEIQGRYQKGANLTDTERRLGMRKARAAKGAASPRLEAIFRARLDPASGIDVAQAVNLFQQDPNVEYAEPNYIIQVEADAGASRDFKRQDFKALEAVKTPNDPLYSMQWALNNTGQLYPASGRFNSPPGTADCDIDAPEAWVASTGGTDVVVAVVDTGVDLTHRDLQGNLWTNTAELNGQPGVDDDGNGYIDDVHGVNFIDRKLTPADDHGHGTHCSGIIAARGNNGLDISGVCWNARIMALKFLGKSGSGSASASAMAIHYAAVNGADVVSCSFGGSGASQVQTDAITDALSQGVVVVAAAGNNAIASVSYPAAIPGVIAVGATNSNDQMSTFTSYGYRVDVSAPGVDILSLMASGTRMGTPCTSYTTVASGTSMACPYVSGAAALILSKKAALTVDQMCGLLRLTADPKPQPLFLGDGRINVAAALAESALPPVCRLAAPPVRASDSRTGGVFDLKGAADGALFTSYTLYYGYGGMPQSWTRIATRQTPVTSGTLFAAFDSWSLEEGPYTFRLVVQDRQGRRISSSQLVRIRNIEEMVPKYNDILKPGKTLDITLTAVTDSLIPESIEWGLGVTPVQWSNRGITLLNGNAGLMGKWDTSFITSNNFYTLRIAFRTGGGRKGVAMIRAIYMDTRLKEGWPQYLQVPGNWAADYSMMTVADLDGDKHEEILCVEMADNYSKKPAALLVYRDNGQLWWRRELDRYPTLTSSGRPLGPPVIGDVNRDGKKEVIVDSGAHSEVTSTGQIKNWGYIVYGFRCDGTPLAGWPVELKGQGLDKMIADVDRDGYPEIVIREVVGGSESGTISQYSQYLYILNAAGEIRARTKVGGYPENFFPYKCHGLAVGNFDDQPDLEIATYYSTSDKTTTTTLLVQQPLLMKWDGTPLPGWPMNLKGLHISNFITADVNRDGYDELLFLASESVMGKHDGALYLVDRHGRPLPGWPIKTGLDIVQVKYYMAVSAGDINGDGAMEIVVTCRDRGDGQGTMEAYDVHGKRLPGWPSLNNRYTASATQPVIGDITGDGRPDIVSVAGIVQFDTQNLSLDLDLCGGIWAWQANGSRIDLCPENSDGYAIWMEGQMVERELHLGDVDNDGLVELVASSCNDISYLLSSKSKKRNSIYIWDLPVKWNSKAAQWPNWQHDPALTGHYHNPAVTGARNWARYR